MARWVLAMQRGGSPRGAAMVLFAATGAAYVGSFALGYTARSLAQIAAARRLHGEVLARVLGATVAWFDKSPIGRIQNRFSSDFQSIDRELGPGIYWFVYCCCNPVSTVASMAIVAPSLLLLLPPVVAYDALVARAYLGAARETKRLGSIHKSPVYEFFTESLHGLATIRRRESVPSLRGTFPISDEPRSRRSAASRPRPRARRASASSSTARTAARRRSGSRSAGSACGSSSSARRSAACARSRSRRS